ncbi:MULTISPECIES: peptidase domain-containing ABC transporter [Bacillus]|uniref:peptidase domain-containing ABC transporter n=1 Tax=Bacillus TaxID=1386 RepID=UPI00019FD90D|nr:MULTISPECIES: ATP-binding cassette domain-containing protein [Bacillus]EEK58954.1 Transporter [Bacillus cereus 172560W]OXB96757.1 transporter [Bacillus sp. M13(2017)]QCY64891.1 ATP-binding cassette domain-containing protein [Bacillus thuringiensis]TBX45819.1 ATP-binding cassette domain-containing protein [Bacillus thuringiensis]WPA85932.1 ATP-binding cassette domain-containing protein [Bacillus cereus]
MLRKKIKFIPQMTSFDCGPSCLAMIMHYYGLAVQASEIRNSKIINKKSSWSLLDIKKVSESYGLSATAYRIENITDLQRIQKPMIAFWGFNHFVIIERVKENKFYIVDPKAGPMVIDIRSFEEMFCNYILVIENKEDIQPNIKKREKHILLRYIDHFVSPSQILLLALLVLLAQISIFAFPFILKKFMDILNASKEVDVKYLLIILGSLIVVIGIKSITSIIKVKFQKEIDRKSTTKVFEHMFNIPIEKITTRHAGDLNVRIMSLESIRGYILEDLIEMIISIVVIIPLLMYLLYTETFYTLILMFFIASSLFINISLGKFIYNANLVETYYLGEHRGKINESLKAMYYVKATGIFSRIKSVWKKDYNKYLDTVHKRVLKQNALESFNSSLSTIFIIIMLAVGFYNFSKGEGDLSNIFFFIAISSIIFSPVSTIIGSILNWNSVKPLLLRTLDILEEVLEKNGSDTEVDILRGSIQFNNISFSFDDKKIIENLSLNIKNNESIAIVGESGSGKSTLANLLLKLHTPDKGNILIDDRDIKDWNSEELRKKVGLMTQDGVLFRGSLFENLSYFDINYDPLKTQNAIDKLNLSNYIQFQSVTDIFISEGGTNFSGGQRQRLAMLRLFMKEYPILILDEPTNHLDRETANTVIENIFALSSTKIIITHDESILERVDRVYELTDKKLKQREIFSKSKLQTLGKG